MPPHTSDTMLNDAVTYTTANATASPNAVAERRRQSGALSEEELSTRTKMVDQMVKWLTIVPCWLILL